MDSDTGDADDDSASERRRLERRRAEEAEAPRPARRPPPQMEGTAFDGMNSIVAHMVRENGRMNKEDWCSRESNDEENEGGMQGLDEGAHGW